LTEQMVQCLFRDAESRRERRRTHSVYRRILEEAGIRLINVCDSSPGPGLTHAGTRYLMRRRLYTAGYCARRILRRVDTIRSVWHL
jgi:hypothetical protein